MLLSLLFWICVTGVITPYVFYPAWLFVLSRCRAKETHTGQPVSVTFVVSAYNEADIIAQKIENTLSLNYPKELLQIVIISDASDDGTDDIVSEYDAVELIRQSPRGGKSAGINSSFDHFRGEIIVFSDANAIYQADAIIWLVRHFGNPKTGYVAGRQLYYDAEGAAQASESTYWNFELKLKAWESRLSSVVGGDGAIIAIRRELFSPLQSDDINDFALPLRMVAAGFRGRFEPRAVCYEEAAPSLHGEFQRKVRIVNRSIRAVVRVPQALNPLRVGVFAAQLFCHKVVRWFASFLMLGALVTSGALAISGSEFYLALFGLQASWYLFALTARWTPIGNFKPAMLTYCFCMSNIAGGLGVLYFMLGRKFSTWTPQRETVVSKNGQATRNSIGRELN